MISSVRFCVRNISKKNIRTYHNIKINSKNREARMLNRIFAKTNQKKNPNVRTDSLLKSSLMEPDKQDGGNRKGTALNKVYMEHVTELIQSGNHSSKIISEGLEVTKITLTKGGDYLNIYWMCNNRLLTEEAICKMLELASKELQQQMGSIRYVAKTPFVRFVRDLKMERAQTVERLLKIADFGENYEPVHPESVITPESNISDDGLPEMRQNVFGVDHAKIRAKILTAIEIYKVTHTPKKNEFAYIEMENYVPFDKKIFAKFYKRKRILDRKLMSRGLFGWRRSGKLEEEEEENEDDDYANELWKEIKKEQQEEEKEFAKEYQN